MPIDFHCWTIRINHAYEESTFTSDLGTVVLPI